MSAGTRGKAEAALFGAITACAEAATESKDGTKLKVAAEAFEKVVHGPQGGAYDAEQETSTKHEGRTVSESKSTSTYAGKTEYDYHETRHEGERRDRPTTGFTPPDEAPE